MLKPWISRENLQKCKEKDKLLKSISKGRDPAKKVLHEMIIRS